MSYPIESWTKEAIYERFERDRDAVYEIAKRVRRGEEVSSRELDFAGKWIQHSKKRASALTSVKPETR